MGYRNRIALFLWVFATAWVAMLASMTLVLWRDGAPADHPRAFYATVLGLFWLAGLGLSAFAMRQACTRVQLFDDGSLEVRQRFPFRRVVQRFPASFRPRAYLVESTDSEGDPYFACELGIGRPFRTPMRVVEGPRARCEAACARLNGARR